MQQPVKNSSVDRLSLYDFDGTIYNGDSLIDFWLFTIRKKITGFVYIPYQLVSAAFFLLGLVSAGRMKERLLLPIRLFDQTLLKKHIEEFWIIHSHKINPWVRDALQGDKKNGLLKVCISASPDFILQSIAADLSFDALIATEFVVADGRQTNRLATPNCRGDEKARRLTSWAESRGPSYVVEKVYSDSDIDTPLFKLAKHGYRVRKGVVLPD